MGLFKKKPAQATPPPAVDPEFDEKIRSGLVVSVMRDVDMGIAAIGPDYEVSRREVEESVERLAAYAVQTHDEQLVLLLRRISIGYRVDEPDSEMTIAEWGELFFDNTPVIKDYRENWLAAGRPDLERDLSTYAVTQVRVVEVSPNFEPIMDAIREAAATYVKEHGQ